MKYEIQQMLTQGAGAIVFVNEWSGGALPGSLPICQQTCSDGADAIGLDYAKQGIRINAVNPGPTTDLWLVALTRWASRSTISDLWFHGRSVRQRNCSSGCVSLL